MNIQPAFLEGEFVRLEPLKIEHLDDLFEAGIPSSLWLWTSDVIKQKDDMKIYIESALADQEKNIALPFVTIEKKSGKIIGSTRFGNIDANNRKTEIGWTWINPQWQRTFVNTEVKLLMLSHAFEYWNCIRVELKTDVLNEKSRNAILRLGAKQEGILRKHMITSTGRLRDTVYFSIIDDEWNSVKEKLQSKLRF